VKASGNEYYRRQGLGVPMTRAYMQSFTAFDKESCQAPQCLSFALSA
jgi:hypothetical protein